MIREKPLKNTLLVVVILTWFLSWPWQVSARRTFTLDEAIDYALGHSPLLKIGRHELSASSEARQVARGRFYPWINGYVDYSRLSDPAVVVPIKSFGGPLPTFSRDQYRAGVSVKIPIYQGGRLRAGLSVAELAGRIAQANLRMDIQNTVANVTNLFNRVLYLKALIGARQDTLSALERAKDDARERLKVGKIAPVDLMRIETQVAAQRQALIEAQEDKRRSSQGLALFMGRDPSEEIDVAGTLSRASAITMDAVVTRLEKLVDNRPDVKRALEKLKQAEANLKVARGQALPSLAFVADYSRRAGSGLDADEEVWSGGLRIDLNIFSGGIISAQIRQARARLLAARERLRQARLNGKTRILQALSEMREALSRYRVARSTAETAEETFRIEDLKYRSGAGTVTDSLLAQSAWLNAKANELSAMYDTQRARVDYLLATGLIGTRSSPAAAARHPGQRQPFSGPKEHRLVQVLSTSQPEPR